MIDFIFRKIIHKLPGIIIKRIPKPSPRIIAGAGARRGVGALCKDCGASNVLIVTDKTLYGLGSLDSITASLENEEIPYHIFHNITGEPTSKVIEEGRAEATKHNIDCIVAIGGGSVMDSCKMIAAGMRLKRLKGRLLLQKVLFVPGKTVPIIALPSTAGTGAEVTVGAIVTSSNGKKKHATVIVGLNVSVVVLDCELSMTVPKMPSLYCGIDALSHGIEGTLTDMKVDEATTRSSLDCIKLVFENLPHIASLPEKSQEPQDLIEVRQSLCQAALLGGYAINNQLAGYVHAFAHSIGSLYKLPHGQAIAICLLPVLRYQKKQCTKRYAQIARWCWENNGKTDTDTTYSDDNLAAEKFLSEIERLLLICDIQEGCDSLCDEDFPTLETMILNDAINYVPPVVFKRTDVRNILNAIKR